MAQTPTKTSADVKSAGIECLKQDGQNARKHNPRNIGVIRKSIASVGTGRSIVIDEHDRVLAGNGVLEAAKAEGIRNVIVVDSTGQDLVAVRRTGLTEEQKTHLAIANNRAAELSTWDEPVLEKLLPQIPKDALEMMELQSSKVAPSPSRIVELKVAKPPEMAWVLVGVPLERFGELQPLLDKLPPDATIKTTAANAR